MNTYWAGALSLLLIALIGGCYYVGYQHGESTTKVACEKHDVAQEQVTINAAQGVIKTQQTQAAINNQTETDYEKTIANVDSAYDLDGVQPGSAAATGDHLPATGSTSDIVSAPRCQTASRKYKMSFKQCDEQEAGYLALWNDWQAQAAVSAAPR